MPEATLERRSKDEVVEESQSELPEELLPRPKWVMRITEKQLFDKELLRIYNFYVFCSPCENVSSMGKYIVEYGWNDSNKLYERLISIGTNPIKIGIVKRELVVDKFIEVSGSTSFPLDISEDQEEIACFSLSTKGGKQFSKLQSLLYHIRNALAHCRYRIYPIHNDRIIALEDAVIGTTTITVSARILIKMSTLLKWIEIIEAGDEQFALQRGN